MASSVLENVLTAWPLLVVFLSLMAAIFACKAHGEAPHAMLAGLLEQLAR